MRFKIVVIILFSCSYGFSQNSNLIDSLINNSIKLKAFPSAQIFIKKGDFIYSKSYGFHTYDSITKVENNHIYDLASITKTMAGSLAIMKLVQDYNLDIHSPIKKYFKEFKRTKMGESKIKDLLTHTAGWKPYISHQFTLLKRNGNLKKRFISKKKKSNNLSLSKNLFIKSNFYKIIKKRIRKSELNNVGEYRYSGLFFCLIPELTENMSGISFDDFLTQSFYNNYQITFNPLKNYYLNKIVPTEMDSLFRNELVHGTVHDETAALMGGISANAGLFANAESLGSLLNNLIDKESALFDTKLFNKFTENNIINDSLNRRGLGFDKVRYISNGSIIYPHSNLSKDSFGHTGFTGTMYWVDSKKDLIFIFLTNRVNPTRESDVFYKLDVREKLLDLIL